MEFTKHKNHLIVLTQTLVLLLIINILIPSANAAFDVNLINSFFKAKFLKFGFVFDCLSSKERINLTRYLMGSDLRISQKQIEFYNSTLQNMPSVFHHHYGVIVDGDCEHVEDLLEVSGQLQLFNDRYHWLIIASNWTILQQFTEVILNINAEIQIAVPNKNYLGNNYNWTIKDVYNQASQHGGELKITNVGFYNKIQGFNVEKKVNKYWTRRNMTGTTFRGIIVLREPFEGTLEDYLQSDENRKVEAYDRFHNVLTHHCKDFYNFSLKSNVTNNWGYMTTNGSFSGLVGMLQRKEIDFSNGALFLKTDRFPIMDYGRGFWEFRSIFIFRQPSARSFSQTFLHPLESSVWYTSLAAMILVVMVLKFTQTAELKMLKTLQNSVDQGWSASVLFVLGIFCQQGCTETSTLLCSRIVTISILLFCLLFYQFYSGSIVSLLLIKAPIKIKDIRDLIDSPLKIGIEDVPYVQDFFRQTTDPTVLELYHNRIFEKGNVSHFYQTERGMQLVEKGGCAFHIELFTAYDIIERTFPNKAICELGEVGLIPVNVICASFQKHSPIREMFNYCLQRLSEHGIAERQKKHWSITKPECLESNSVSFEVGLKDIYPAIVLLFAGILISFVIFGLEFMAHNTPKKQRNVKKSKKFRYPFIN